MARNTTSNTTPNTTPNSALQNKMSRLVRQYYVGQPVYAHADGNDAMPTSLTPGSLCWVQSPTTERWAEATVESGIRRLVEVQETLVPVWHFTVRLVDWPDYTIEVASGHITAYTSPATMAASFEQMMDTVGSIHA